jgi:hypothetical protein
VFAAWLDPERGPPPADVVPGAARVVAQVAAADDGRLKAEAVELAGRLAQWPDRAELRADCRELVKACLADADAAARLRAIPVAVLPRVGLVEPVVALLNDPSAEVRREALRSVGPLKDAVSDDSLLRWLHDPDPEVRLLCELVLKNRGLDGKDVHLGRLLTDRKPATRLLVLERLSADDQVEPGVWLRRLSVDPAPEVRVAAIRAAFENPLVDLSDRIEQMAHDDPSPTVSQLARYYHVQSARRKPRTVEP